MALVDLVEKLSTAIDNKLVTIGVFIDLKKAFDTIDHSLLIKKLMHYGIRGTAANWLNSYLSNRKQFVCINGINSDYQKVMCGVPHGSILGPKLFILYINDICNISNILNFIIFADDTNIFCTGDKIEAVAATVSIELNKLHNWFALNKLSLNIKKTNYMVFSKKNCTGNFDVTINNFEIERVFVTKFLGVLIDTNLKWKSHTSYVKGKIYKSISLLCKAKLLLNQSALFNLYNAIIQPHLSYCCEIWGNTNKIDLLPLIVAQQKAIRLVCNVGYRDHTTFLFKNLKVLKFEDIVKHKVCMLLFKGKRGLLPRNIQCLFTLNTNNKYCTRQCNYFKIKFARTSIKSSCVSISGVKQWNSLCTDILNCNSLCVFKKMLKCYYLSQY